MKFYLNGKMTGEHSAIDLPPLPGFTYVLLGGNVPYDVTCGGCHLDDIEVYSRALDDHQVAMAYARLIKIFYCFLSTVQ